MVIVLMKFLIELFTVFDWITPIKGFVEDIYHDPTFLHTNSWTFFIPYNQCLDNGWNAFMIEQMLREHGIKHWGSQITNGKYFFSVPKSQARWAEYLITGSGIPVDPRSLGTPEPVNKIPNQYQPYKSEFNNLYVVNNVSPFGAFVARGIRSIFGLENNK